MKVCQFLPYFPPHKGGLETVAEEFSKYFVSEGCWEVLNVVFSVGQESLAAYKKNGYQVLILPAFDLIPNYPFPKFWTKQFWSVLQQAKKRNPDIIQTHTRFFLATFFGGICAKLWKKKWVHIEHGSWYVKGLVWRKSLLANLYDWTLWRIALGSADAIVAISKGNIPFIHKFTKKPIEVIYRGIDFPEIKKKEQKTDQIFFGFVGRLVKLKGVDLLISAFSSLAKKYPNLYLQIAWDGVEKNNLETLVEELGIGDKVSFLWFQEQKVMQNQILPSRDILVNPSLQEGLPTTVIEGLLAKTIVVATDVGGTKEISDQKDLLLIAPWEVADIEQWLEAALSLVWKVNGTSSKQVREKFDWSKGVKKYLELYSGLSK